MSWAVNSLCMVVSFTHMNLSSNNLLYVKFISDTVSSFIRQVIVLESACGLKKYICHLLCLESTGMMKTSLQLSHD